MVCVGWLYSSGWAAHIRRWVGLGGSYKEGVVLVRGGLFREGVKRGPYIEGGSHKEDSKFRGVNIDR